MALGTYNTDGTRQTPKEYYAGTEKCNYQFISITDIINNFIVSQVGDDKIIKSANNIIKGRLFAGVDEGTQLAKSNRALEAEKIANNVNTQLEDAGIKSKLKYTLAEAADDKDLLAVQSSFENVRRLGKTGEFQEFGEKQAGALNEYYKLLQKDFGGATGSNYDTGVLIKEVLDRRNKDVVKNIIKKTRILIIQNQ